ncbi:MAG: hypothetical protein K0S75_1445 [Clostridia bacterium]|jgi:hypothetical protein|nr:hypothetical protein [Clostridia bacterium]
MYNLGSLIIYDNNGRIWYNSGDMAGSVNPTHTIPVGLPYIITEYGELDGLIVESVDPVTKLLITQSIL